MGTPTKLTPATQRTIITALLDGNYVETSCNLADVTRQAFYEWLRTAKAAQERQARDGLPFTKRERKLVRFRRMVLGAMAEAEARDIRTIRLAGASDWRAVAWRLERRSPKRWGSRVDVTSKDQQLQGGIPIAALRAFLGDGEPPEEPLDGDG